MVKIFKQAIVTDLGDKKVIGWALSSRINATEQLYPRSEWHKRTDQLQLKCFFILNIVFSMPVTNYGICWQKTINEKEQKENCCDNVLVENFFKTLRRGNVYKITFETSSRLPYLVSHICILK